MWVPKPQNPPFEEEVVSSLVASFTLENLFISNQSELADVLTLNTSAWLSFKHFTGFTFYACDIIGLSSPPSASNIDTHWLCSRRVSNVFNVMLSPGSPTHPAWGPCIPQDKFLSSEPVEQNLEGQKNQNFGSKLSFCRTNSSAKKPVASPKPSSQATAHVIG